MDRVQWRESKWLAVIDRHGIASRARARQPRRRADARDARRALDARDADAACSTLMWTYQVLDKSFGGAGMPASRLDVVPSFWTRPGPVPTQQDRWPHTRLPSRPPDIGIENAVAFSISMSHPTPFVSRKLTVPASRKTAAPFLFYFIFSILLPPPPVPPSALPRSPTFG
ncbi:hypothetical protein GLOTRDRAFT_134282 [Gloeophyllum trabeum ATCC 11539]|uniref:Uncharacterized protein n=1 Tax=Gloeophyllum trabeum (strain ATCC 11539 / FP-39264 / Madison 617) TaxID=670483 RepID=S7PRR5_GLOTA|nr:uncharacterized protein GLOTRDRAFT_134282 [Gloeophyllum trabeum ATCC 11539]EPQ50073.1 hypothetical protein GLOTRDRAFT_134282 [Gloeophyllum trabeum ATCC 11539]